LISAALIVLAIAGYLAFLVQQFIGIFFNSLLADRALAQLGKKADDDRLWKEWAKHTVHMLLTSVTKTLLFLLLGLVFFGFSLLPGLNLLALLGAFALVAFDCIDYSFEALGFGLRRRFAYMLSQWAQWAGMTAALALTLLVPGLTLLVIPGAVVGAALIIKVERSL
jgi:uncharacterized protein involved in cysteine biosynthesis